MQLGQACPSEDGPGLLGAGLPQRAAAGESAAIPLVLEQQARMGTLPAEQLADPASGSEANVQACAAHGVELIAPVPGRAASVPCPEPSAEPAPPRARPPIGANLTQTENWICQ